MSKTDQAVSNVYYFLRGIIGATLVGLTGIKAGVFIGFLSIFFWWWVIDWFLPVLEDKSAAPNKPSKIKPPKPIKPLTIGTDTYNLVPKPNGEGVMFVKVDK